MSKTPARCDASKLPPGSPAGETASSQATWIPGSFLPVDAVPEPVPTEGVAGKQRLIDVSNLRFYGRMFEEHKWQTDVLHWTVFVQTLNEIASRIESSQPSAPEAAAAGEYVGPLPDKAKANEPGGAHTHDWQKFYVNGDPVMAGVRCERCGMTKYAAVAEPASSPVPTAAPIAPAAAVHVHLGIKESDLSTLDSQQLRALMGGIAQVLKSRGAA